MQSLQFHIKRDSSTSIRLFLGSHKQPIAYLYREVVSNPKYSWTGEIKLPITTSELWDESLEKLIKRVQKSIETFFKNALTEKPNV